MKLIFKSEYFLLPLFVISLLTSCYPYYSSDPYIVYLSRQKENVYYIPTSPNAPLLSNKGNLSVSVQSSSSSKHSGAEVQAAYLPTRHIGIITNFSAGNNKSFSNLNYTKLEAGAGYITNINKSLLIENYAGYGYSKISNRHYTGFSKTLSHNIFIQPAIAIKNKTLQFSVVSKFSGNFMHLQDTFLMHDREPFVSSQFQVINNQPFHLFWEPAVVFRFGWEQFVFHTGYSYSTDLTNKDLYRAKNNYSLGFTLKFNTNSKMLLVE